VQTWDLGLALDLDLDMDLEMEEDLGLELDMDLGKVVEDLDMDLEMEEDSGLDLGLGREVEREEAKVVGLQVGVNRRRMPLYLHETRRKQMHRQRKSRRLRPRGSQW